MIFDATPQWSGGANRILLYSKELKKRGHCVTVCCLPESGLANRIAKENIPVYTLNPKSDINLLIVPKIIRLIKKNKIEVIDICSPKFYWVSSLAARVTKSTVVLTRNVPYRKKGVKKQINRILYHTLVDHIIAISDKIKRELIEDYALPEQKITVIYDGIELNRFKQKIPEKIGVTSRHPVAAVISRLDENKGLECFIHAIAEITKKIASVHFVIVGTGSIETRLKELTTKLKVSSNVRFMGFRKDIPEILAGVDITIVPSPEEGMSMSALESMASGVPVVVTSGCGLVDIIVNNTSGMIVKPGNSHELAQGVIKLLQSDYQQAGKEARAIVEKKFALPRVVTQYELLLEALQKQKTLIPES